MLPDGLLEDRGLAGAKEKGHTLASAAVGAFVPPCMDFMEGQSKSPYAEQSNHSAVMPSLWIAPFLNFPVNIFC